MSVHDRAAIALRIRGLIAGQDMGDLGRTAARLGVEEVSLRMSIDDLSPFPTLDVMLAIIREYGVDPSWLLTGTYDPAMHRAAMQDDAAVLRALSAFSPHRPPRISEPTRPPFNLNEQN